MCVSLVLLIESLDICGVLTSKRLYCIFVASEEEAKKKIYNVSCERYFGFGCEIDEETSNKLEGLFRC